MEGNTRPCGLSLGECEPGVEMCVDGEWRECVGGTGPSPELCDGKDNDCNGLADDGDPEGGMTCVARIGETCFVGTTHCYKGGSVPTVLCVPSNVITSCN